MTVHEDKVIKSLRKVVADHERAELAMAEIDVLDRTPRTTEEAMEAAARIGEELFPDYPIIYNRFKLYAEKELEWGDRSSRPALIAKVVGNLYKSGDIGKSPADWTEAVHWAMLYWPEHEQKLLKAIEKNTNFVAEDALKRAVQFIRPQEEEFVGNGFVTKTFTADEFANYPDHPAELVPKLFYKGEAHLLAGISAAGKTTVALRMLLDIALGRPVLGMFARPEPGKVLYVSAEDRAEATVPRLRRMLADNAEATKNFLSNFSFIDLTSVSSFLHARDPDNREALRKNALFESLNRHFKNEKPALVILDPLVAFFAGNENDNNQAATFMKDLRNLAEQSEVAMLLIHHVSKADGRGGEYDQWAARGASAFVSNCRRTFQVATPQARTFKANGIRWRIPDNITDEHLGDGRVMMLIEHKDSYMRLWVAPFVILRTHGFDLETFACERAEGEEDDQHRRDDQLVLEFLRNRFAAGGEPVTSKLIRDIIIGNLSQNRKQSSFSRMQDQGYFFMRKKAGTNGQEAFALNEELINIGEQF